MILNQTGRGFISIITCYVVFILTGTLMFHDESKLKFEIEKRQKAILT